MTAITDARFWLRLAAFALLLAAAWRPVVAVDRPVYTVIAVLDITGSMNVRDQHLDGAAVSRIAMEKRSVHRLLAALPCGSRLGLAVFVEAQPFLLFAPVETCDNFDPLDREITAIDWRMGWDSESHIAETLRASMKLAIGQQSDLIFMTDGQEMPPLAWSSPIDFGDLHGLVHGMIVGVGGHDLAAIPKFDPSGREIGVFQPGDVPSEHQGMFRGHEHLSAVDERHLLALSAQTGLGYTHLDAAGGLASALTGVAGRRTLKTFVSLAPGFGIAALGLLVVACWRGRTGETASSPFLKKRTKKRLSIGGRVLQHGLAVVRRRGTSLDRMS